MVFSNMTSNSTNSSVPTKPVAGFGHPSSSRMSEGSHTFLIVVYSLLSIVGISGNLFVCYVLGKLLLKNIIT